MTRIHRASIIRIHMAGGSGHRATVEIIRALIYALFPLVLLKKGDRLAASLGVSHSVGFFFLLGGGQLVRESRDDHDGLFSIVNLFFSP